MSKSSAARRPQLAVIPQPAVATPTDLLRRMDCWLQNAGHEPGSTWRRSISDTLQLVADQHQQLAAPKALPAARLAAVFGEAAALAHRADVDANDLGGAEDWQAEAQRLRAVVCRLGWLADLGADLAGAEPVRGDAAWWLLSADVRAAVLSEGADRA